MNNLQAQLLVCIFGTIWAIVFGCRLIPEVIKDIRELKDLEKLTKTANKQSQIVKDLRRDTISARLWGALFIVQCGFYFVYVFSLVVALYASLGN